MRIFPVITAIFVTGILYFLIFERGQLFEFAQIKLNSNPEQAETSVDPVIKTLKEPVEEGNKGFTVVVKKSIATQLDSVIVLRGRSEAARQVIVKSETTGLITSKPISKGTKIKSRQLLCEIDPGIRESSFRDSLSKLREASARTPEANSRVNEAKARIVEAEINYLAAKKLKRGGYASDSRLASTQALLQMALANFETAKAGVETAKARIASATANITSAQKELDRLKILAPFEGYLESDTAEIGSLMQPGSICATIVDLSSIKLVGFVPENAVSKIKLGAQASGRTVSGLISKGRVSFISKSADQSTRTFRLEVEIDNTDGGLSDGQTVEIKVGSDGKKAHLIPSSALTLNANGYLGVMLFSKQKAKFVPIELIRDTASGVWVSGLDEQADIIVVGQEYLTDEVKVFASYLEE
jgi:multidrug efflux system membrane fusion protein